ncbi:MAG: hypothetical protein R6X02_24665 [Enhygromyxa sp.]
MALRLAPRPCTALLLSLGLLPGCGGEESRRGPEAGITTLGGGTTGDSDDDPSAGDGDGDGSEDSSATTDDSSTTDEGFKFDLGELPGDGDGDPLAEGECQKVDLLFVIDNSGSMQGEQESLIASFDGFVAGIQDALESAESYHIGVVTTDSYSHNPSGCRSLGALVTSTGGTASSSTDCQPFASGKRYLDDTEPDLAAKFSCIAQVGISGDSKEIQAQAGYQAISPALNAPGACNEGFIRDDALLVVVIITDEDDKEDCVLFFGCEGGSDGDPPDWAQTFTQYKGGIEENIVVLSLVGGPNNSCGANNCSRLIQMTNLFTNGSVGDICAPSYEDFFNEAISVIDSACSNFTPPG